MSNHRFSIDDELLARARIHARSVLKETGLAVDLSRIEWDVSPRAKRRAGVCRWDADAGVATIVLTRRAYRAYDADAFEAVVRHELIHAWQFQRFGEAGHGARFREVAAELDAPRRCESFSDPRYVLRCLDADCEWTASRHRASEPVKTPSRYRCGRCGGAYAVEHVASGRTWTTAGGYGGTKAALGSDW